MCETQSSRVPRVKKKLVLCPRICGDFSSFREKLLRNEDAPLTDDGADGGQISLGTSKPHLLQAHFACPDQGASQELMRIAATPGTWPNTVADTPALAPQCVGKKVPQVGYAHDHVIADQPIRRMWYEARRQPLASGTCGQPSQERGGNRRWKS